MVTNGDSGNIGTNDANNTMTVHWSYNGTNGDINANGNNNDNGTNSVNGENDSIGDRGKIGTNDVNNHSFETMLIH